MRLVRVLCVREAVRVLRGSFLLQLYPKIRTIGEISVICGFFLFRVREAVRVLRGSYFTIDFTKIQIKKPTLMSFIPVPKRNPAKAARAALKAFCVLLLS